LVKIFNIIFESIFKDVLHFANNFTVSRKTARFLWIQIYINKKALNQVQTPDLKATFFFAAKALGRKVL